MSKKQCRKLYQLFQQNSNAHKSMILALQDILIVSMQDAMWTEKQEMQELKIEHVMEQLERERS